MKDCKSKIKEKPQKACDKCKEMRVRIEWLEWSGNSKNSLIEYYKKESKSEMERANKLKVYALLPWAFMAGLIVSYFMWG